MNQNQFEQLFNLVTRSINLTQETNERVQSLESIEFGLQ